MRLAHNFFQKRTTPKNSGEQAEQFAEAFLSKQGLKFVGRNYHCRMGEIDLIFLDGRTYVFVEVRFRASARHGNAAESLNASKLQKVRKASSHWLQQHNQQVSECRFDAVLFDEKIDLHHLTWLRAVF